MPPTIRESSSVVNLAKILSYNSTATSVDQFVKSLGLGCERSQQKCIEQSKPQPTKPLISSEEGVSISHCSVPVPDDERVDYCPKKSLLDRHSFERKTVRFADSQGVQLVQVRLYFVDELPDVPKSAFKHLKYTQPSRLAAAEPFPRTQSQSTLALASLQHKSLISTFNHPSSRADFFDVLREQKVFLEHAYFSEGSLVKGNVRVANMDFDKTVTIRYTTDEWKSCEEVQCTYVNGSNDGFSDSFEFVLPANPALLQIGAKLSFAIKYTCQNHEFWDNNFGRNYTFTVAPTSVNQNRTNSSVIYRDMLDDYGIYSSMTDHWTTHLWV